MNFFALITGGQGDAEETHLYTGTLDGTLEEVRYRDGKGGVLQELPVLVSARDVSKKGLEGYVCLGNDLATGK